MANHTKFGNIIIPTKFGNMYMYIHMYILVYCFPIL